MASPSPATNERLARRVPEELASEKRLELVEELYAEDAVEHTPTGEFRGRAAIREDMERVFTAFPDITATVEDVVAAGDTVAMRVTLRGTHEGAFAGMEPTGKSFEVDNMVWTRIEDGRIAERWIVPDMLGLMTQVGAIDAPTP